MDAMSVTINFRHVNDPFMFMILADYSPKNIFVSSTAIALYYIHISFGKVSRS